MTEYAAACLHSWTAEPAHLDLDNHLIDLRLKLTQVLDVQHAEHSGRVIQLLICKNL